MKSVTEVIEKLMDKAALANDACQAQQFAQAALNVANASCTMPRASASGITEDQIKHMVTVFSDDGCQKASTRTAYQIRCRCGEEA
jgi:hypothetical protein